ncbi:hypothetical protein QAD02_003959 [Eretmocerus hayati]|uniref:Uncharacterized protein n=1 Tax=Eretmocerus hayati TaxID=131215 RepID=A0ACC2NN59_9HYME|nr:hypothetical protein QAD02_003959 [Eretmocerus hayati]
MHRCQGTDVNQEFPECVHCVGKIHLALRVLSGLLRPCKLTVTPFLCITAHNSSVTHDNRRLTEVLWSGSIAIAKHTATMVCPARQFGAVYGDISSFREWG